MAQDFENEFASSISNSSGSPTTIVTANSDDALISIRCVNKHTSAVNVSVTITDSGATAYFVIKDAPVPVGGSLELIDSGSKIVMQNGDVLKAYADTASAVDVLVSRVDAIST
jgi:enoyl-[acyl-carrier-protein] reductase (NADH)